MVRETAYVRHSRRLDKREDIGEEKETYFGGGGVYKEKQHLVGRFPGFACSSF